MAIWGILGAMGLSRVIYSASGTAIHKTAFSQGLRSPLFQGGGFGVGYTGGAYTGYGLTNTADPFGIHNKKSYKSGQTREFRMPYGYAYGRRRYRRRYTRYSRYSGYRRYGRRSYRRSYY